MHASAFADFSTSRNGYGIQNQQLRQLTRGYQRHQDLRQTAIGIAVVQSGSSKRSLRVVPHAEPGNVKEGYKVVLLADVVQGKEDHFLGADIGGTNARFYLFATQRRNPMRSELLYEEVFGTRTAGEDDSSGKVSIIKYINQFLLNAAKQPGLSGIRAEGMRHACFAVAGPVSREGGSLQADLTNADWECIISTQIEKEAQLRGVTLINDFEAQGRGITLLRQKPNLVTKSIAEVGTQGLVEGTDVVTLYTPKQLKPEEPISPIKPNTKKHPIVVLGPGTGLGEALAFCDPNGYLQVFPTEGGHCGFCPWDDVTRAMQLFFDHVYGFAEQETILCGKGLVRLYVFLKACYWDEAAKKLDLSKQLLPDEVRRIADGQRGVLELVDDEKYDIMPHHVTLIMELCDGGDTCVPAETYADGSPLIEKHQRRRDEIMKMVDSGVLVIEAMIEAFLIFLTALGVEAGGMALNTLAYGGVYLSGGIIKRPGTLQVLAKHNKNTFLKGYFLRRENFRQTLEEMPVYIVTNEYVAALGSLSGAMDAFNAAEVENIWGKKTTPVTESAEA